MVHDIGESSGGIKNMQTIGTVETVPIPQAMSYYLREFGYVPQPTDPISPYKKRWTSSLFEHSDGIRTIWLVSDATERSMTGVSSDLQSHVEDPRPKIDVPYLVIGERGACVRPNLDEFFHVM